jgi:hypothetical protein
LEGLPIQSEGELRFEALLNDQHAAEHVVTVTQVRPVDVAESLRVEPE